MCISLIIIEINIFHQYFEGDIYKYVGTVNYECYSNFLKLFYF